MNEEEAINQLKQWLSVIDFKSKSNIIPNIDDIEAIETVLNLIEKQQAEIEELKDGYNRIFKNNVALRDELDNKDKIINEMAKELYKRGFDIDICDNCSEYNDDCKYIYDCIKQYFERKIEQ